MLVVSTGPCFVAARRVWVSDDPCQLVQRLPTGGRTYGSPRFGGELLSQWLSLLSFMVNLTGA